MRWSSARALSLHYPQSHWQPERRDLGPVYTSSKYSAEVTSTEDHASTVNLSLVTAARAPQAGNLNSRPLRVRPISSKQSPVVRSGHAGPLPGMHGKFVLKRRARALLAGPKLRAPFKLPYGKKKSVQNAPSLCPWPRLRRQQVELETLTGVSRARFSPNFSGTLKPDAGTCCFPTSPTRRNCAVHMSMKAPVRQNCGCAKHLQSFSVIYQIILTPSDESSLPSSVERACPSR